MKHTECINLGNGLQVNDNPENAILPTPSPTKNRFGVPPDELPQECSHSGCQEPAFFYDALRRSFTCEAHLPRYALSMRPSVRYLRKRWEQEGRCLLRHLLEWEDKGLAEMLPAGGRHA